MLGNTRIRIAPSDADSRLIEGAKSWRRAIVVMPGYQASAKLEGIGAGSVLLRIVGQLWRSLTSATYRAHVRLYRDFYANPRPVEYMNQRVGEFLAAACPGAQIDLLKMPDLDFTAQDAPWAQSVQSVTSENPSSLRDMLHALLDSARPDGVLLVHPDAIGLGQEPVEEAILRSYTGPVLVLNGRRRCYSLSPSRRARLRRHRFLADTRLVEAGFALCLPVLATFYATLDRATSARRG